MPTEIRKIVFNIDEVRSAAVEFCLRNSVAMPKANIGDVKLGDEADAAVNLVFTTANPAHPNTVSLSRDQCAAALIRYCIEHKIPLPRHARKVLQVDEADNTLALMMKVEL